jgi:AcrR family transcriptional regulator
MIIKFSTSGNVAFEPCRPAGAGNDHDVGSSRLRCSLYPAADYALFVSSDQETADLAVTETGASWRDLAVNRSLDTARVRAENRVQRFLDAGFELANRTTGTEFTVQAVVEESGQSLRSFYQYFGAKHELLLAMFEDVVRSTADSLREKVAEEDDPLARLHRFVVEHHRLCRPAPSGGFGKERAGTPIMVEFAQQLLTAHPAEAARAFHPMASLFGEVLDEAAEAGVVREGLRDGPVAGIVLEAIMFNAFSSTIVGASLRPGETDPAEEFWDLIMNGIGVDEPT